MKLKTIESLNLTTQDAAGSQMEEPPENEHVA